MAHKNVSLEFLTGFHDEDPRAFAQALREHIARGDFLPWDAVRARLALFWAERTVRSADRNTPEGLALRQARAAEHSAIAAYIALIVSVAALVVSGLAYLKLPAPVEPKQQGSLTQASPSATLRP